MGPAIAGCDGGLWIERENPPVRARARLVARRARPVPVVLPQSASTAVAVPAHGPPFLVAAVGASAGGLEAFSALLRSIPADAPLALILVQHLARDQRSILPELLGNVTTMKVVTARNERAVEPRHVYVIPPDARMTVSDGHLRVRPSSPQREAEGTVDALFRSVAAAYRERAIGVVLSGGAHDGSAGIREIKAVGGLTMVQQPEQATVDGMPRSAIATGTVDAVLPVEEIGEQLARLAKHSFFSRVDDAPVPEVAANVSHMLQVFQLLRRASGIDFNSYKLPTLKRRIERRMALHRLSSLERYLEILQRDPVELQRLQDELLIHVTSFFREPAAYVALDQLVLAACSPAPARGADSGSGSRVRHRRGGLFARDTRWRVARRTRRRGSAPDLRHRRQRRHAGAGAGRHLSGEHRADVSPERLRRFFTKSEGGYRDQQGGPRPVRLRAPGPHRIRRSRSSI